MWVRLTFSCAGMDRDAVLRAIASKGWCAHAVASFGIEPQAGIVPGLILTLHEGEGAWAPFDPRGVWHTVRSAAPGCVCAFLETHDGFAGCVDEWKEPTVKGASDAPQAVHSSGSCATS